MLPLHYPPLQPVEPLKPKKQYTAQEAERVRAILRRRHEESEARKAAETAAAWRAAYGPSVEDLRREQGLI